MIAYLAGVITGFIPAAGVCVLLDRRDEMRRRIQLRVDQTPAPLPGAYEPWAERSLPGVRTHTVVDGEVRS